MNTVPVSILVSVVVLAAVVTAGRWLLVNETAADRLINRAWSWNLLGLLLYGVTSAAHCPDLGRRLFLGGGLMAVGNIFGLARLVDGADTETARRRQRRYDAASAAAAISVFIGEPVVHGALPMEYTEFIWAMTAVPMAFSGFLVGRAAFRELRIGDSSTKERLTYTALLAFSVYWSVSSVIALVRSIAGTPPSEPGRVWAVLAFLMLAVVTLLTAIPLITVLLARAGWDRTGRACRRLRPLWLDLTAAVPEVVLFDDYSLPGESASRLYRMTVEIWDALLHLKPYLPMPAERGAPAEIDNDVRGYALRLAQAVRAKRDGRGPTPDLPARSVAQAQPRDRAAELRYLLELAHEWPKAAAVGRCSARGGATRDTDLGSALDERCTRVDPDRGGPVGGDRHRGPLVPGERHDH
ncbi:MAB_1171c family putative transporter [Nocardia pneumoniae]|uniref:MAB_1171c family putative transporter n=1 Tax=Nocardia pneumoniae TaxID=228601 RepID=UPI0005930E2F|nr:MAB_1171c family putative transporter [Nocardia pneumoniae]